MCDTFVLLMITLKATNQLQNHWGFVFVGAHVLGETPRWPSRLSSVHSPSSSAMRDGAAARRHLRATVAYTSLHTRAVRSNDVVTKAEPSGAHAHLTTASVWPLRTRRQLQSPTIHTRPAAPTRTPPPGQCGRRAEAAPVLRAPHLRRPVSRRGQQGGAIGRPCARHHLTRMQEFGGKEVRLPALYTSAQQSHHAVAKAELSGATRAAPPPPRGERTSQPFAAPRSAASAAPDV
jgi:hypothetical protein